MTSFPAVVALGNTWVHVCCFNGGDVSAEVKGVVD